MTGRASRDERVLELLTEQAVFGLSDAERVELDELLPPGERSPDAESFELAAAAAQLAMTPLMPMPASLRRRLDQSAEAFIAAREREAGQPRAIAGRLAPADAEPARVQTGRWLGWLAAAACLGLAAAAWWPSLKPAPTAGDRRESVAAAPDALRLSWGDFTSLDERKEPPEIAGVQGDVVWSGSRQEGVLFFRNLPPNDPAKERYQLWIVDGRRGLAQRVDGGVFDVAGPGESLVPFRSKLPVSEAVGFAVTIERPDGVVVSDMSRRVVLALKS